MARHQFCTFHVDGFFMGIEARFVQEVLRQQPITHVPLVGNEVSGLVNLRGQIVTAVDLRARLGLKPIESIAKAMHVVIKTDDGPVSLLVDDIGDVLDATDDSFEPPLDTITGVMREVITGVYKLEGKLLLALDTRRCASPTEPARARSKAG